MNGGVRRDLSVALWELLKSLQAGVRAGALVILLSWRGVALAQSLPPQPVVPPTDKGTSPPSRGTVEGVERTLFDVFAADLFVGGTLANYTDTWCEIDDPGSALEQVQDLDKNLIAEVIPLLSGRIESRRTVDGLGEVSCDIYNFRIVVKLEPRFLKGVAREVSKRLPDPERGFSIQQNVGVAATGEVSGDSDSAVTHRTVFGSGRYYGRVNGAAVQGEAYELTEASAYGYLGDYEIGSGFLETTGQSFANSLQITGARIRTSDKLLLNPEEGRGSRLEIFVPSRSRVEFYRSGRLLSVQVLDFGLRDVDTSSFPQGSYDVDVVITESNGNVTQDRKFFTKSGYLSVRGRPNYDVQVGVTREEFDTGDTPIYLAGAQWRAADALDVYGSVYGSDVLAISQLGFTALYGDSAIFGSGSFSTDGDVGVNGTFTTRVFDASLSLSGAKSLEVSENSRELTAVPTPEPGAPPDLIPRTPRTRDLYFQDRSSYSASVRKDIGSFDVGYSLQGENFAGSDDRRTQGPLVNWNIITGTVHTLKFSTSYYKTDDGDVQNNTLSYRYRLSAQWMAGAQLSYTSREEYDEVVGYLTASYFDRRRVSYASRAEISSEVRSRSGSSDGSGESYTNQLALDYGGDNIFGRGFFRDQQGSASGRSSYGVNAESAVILTGSGKAALSYPMSQEAVLIVDLKGSSGESRFEILVNDQVVDTIISGSRVAVSLSPFKTYRVGLRPEDPDEFVDYDTTTYSFTVFPGNIVERSWEAAEIVIVLGRVLDEAGNPIGLQRLQGTREYVATDDEGFFQAELTGKEELLMNIGAERCRITLEGLDRSEYVVNLGDVRCKRVAREDNLPSP